MYNIVASDLDGTLLNPHHQLTDFTKKILKMLNLLNIHFIFATGRSYTDVIRICNDLNIYDYMITANGTRIYNAHGNLIASYNLDLDIIYDLLCIAHNDPKIVTNVFRDDEWLVNRYQLDQEHFLKDLGLNYKIYHKNTLSFDGICKIYFTSNDHQRLLMLEKQLNIFWKKYINISFSLPTCLEIIPIGISKGYALQKVSNLLGYQLKDCISFGDGMNDQEMLLMSGKGCIMGNAQQRLKDALPFLEVIGNNKDDAVSYYLKCMYCK